MRFNNWVLPLHLTLCFSPAVPAVRADPNDDNPPVATAARRPAPAPAGQTARVHWTPVLPSLPEGVAEFSFNRLLVTPVGPAGLELSADAKKLMGQPVRLVGHMVRQTQPIPWTFLLSPVPQSLHEREYFLCDNLPANAVRVQVPKGSQPIVPYQAGLVAVTGILTEEGPAESDGRSSAARLLLRRGDTNGMVFVTAYARSEPTNAPVAAPFSAQNRRELQTDNTPKQ